MKGVVKDRIVVAAVASSGRDKHYNVCWNLIQDGALPEWECACIGWTRHLPRRDCKHIALVKEAFTNIMYNQSLPWGVSVTAKGYELAASWKVLKALRSMPNPSYGTGR